MTTFYSIFHENSVVLYECFTYSHTLNIKLTNTTVDITHLMPNITLYIYYELVIMLYQSSNKLKNIVTYHLQTIYMDK